MRNISKWIFTRTLLTFTFLQLCLIAIPEVDVFTTKEGNLLKFYGKNQAIFPQTIKLKFSTLKGYLPLDENLLVFTIKSKSQKQFLFELKKIPDQGQRLNFKTTISMGAMDSVIDNNYLYYFPYSHGSKHKLSQGFFGKSTHSKVGNIYSLDFMMPIGTKVFSMRGGLVVDVITHNNKGGDSFIYSKYANSITIMHDDGSFAYYVHLKKDGSVVKIGEKITKGQHIGFSGNTGYSSGPHLHVNLSKASKDGSSRTFAFKMFGKGGAPLKAEAGNYYYSRFDGQPSFETKFGKDLKISDFKRDFKPTSNFNGINLFSEKLDDTLIYYIQNGFDFTNKIHLSFIGKNAVS